MTVAVAPPAELMGKPVTVDGKPAVDGVYTVVGGVVTALGEAQAAPATPPAQGTPAADPMAAKLQEILALLKAEPKQDDATAAAATKKKDDEIIALKKQLKTEHVPEGFTPETKADDVKEWDRSFKAGEHVAMRKNEPEKWTRLFYAKYNKMPNV